MPEAEARTRKTKIDQALKKAGWQPILRYQSQASRRLVVLEEHPTLSGPVDYVLFQNNEPLALVEAKKSVIDPQNTIPQALRCAKDLGDNSFDFNGYKVPFIYICIGNSYAAQLPYHLYKIA